MLTLFTIPKAFEGHNGMIQMNAIQSWTMLRPDCEIILLADDDGVADAAKELGVRHIPDVSRNEFGTPLLSHGFERAENFAETDILCHINADILLMGDFITAVQKVQAYSSKFLMTARRTDLEVTKRLLFNPGWEDELRKDVSDRGNLSHATGIDFWAYTRGLFDGMPPFAVGRIATESWLLYKARSMKADVIDSTQVVNSVHQNHDYRHHAGGVVGLGTGIEAQRNREMVGGKRYFFTIRDRTHILTPQRLKKSRDLWNVWRGLRTAPVIHPDLPILLNLLINGVNQTIDVIRDLAIKARNARSLVTRA
jgi:hypothetical protein